MSYLEVRKIKNEILGLEPEILGLESEIDFLGKQKAQKEEELKKKKERLNYLEYEISEIEVDRKVLYLCEKCNKYKKESELYITDKYSTDYVCKKCEENKDMY